MLTTSPTRSQADSYELAALVSPRWWELTVLLAIASLLLCGAILFYDNVHRATTNGLVKSIDILRWVDWSPTRFTDGANLLYYPVVGGLARVMPEQWFGAVWQRMAFINAFLGAAVLALTYAIALRLFRSRETALFACACQLSMGFFLLLSTINEDIMPGYVWFTAAVACAVYIRDSGRLGLVLTAQCVALSWLFHSTLQLPAIGAFVLGIAAAEDDLRRAAPRVMVFCLSLLPLPLVSAIVFGLPWSQGLWSGKGVGSGWGGFSASKVVLMWSGIAQSVLGGQNLTGLGDILNRPQLIRATLTVVVIAVCFGIWIREGVRQRGSRDWRLVVTLLAAVFVLGEAMNLYIQPQDPQMQIQPMSWFPFAAAAVYAAARRWSGRVSIPVRAALVLALVVLGKSNLEAHMSTRGADSLAISNVRALAMLAAPSRTVFLLQGFEGMAAWLRLSWGEGVEWPAPGVKLPPVGQVGRFNAIYISTELIAFQDHGVADASDEIVWDVLRAIEEGYDVVATDMWTMPDESWVGSFSSVSDPDKPRAIRAALQEQFTATPIGAIEGWANLYRLAPKVREAVR